MKSKLGLEHNSLIQMLKLESNNEYHRYYAETRSALSRVVDSNEVLGPLVFQEKLAFDRWKLCGELYYSRFRPGDRVELRTKEASTDNSKHLAYDWVIENVSFSAPGKIEVIISNGKPFESIGNQEVFLFKAYNGKFNLDLVSRMNRILAQENTAILGNGNYKLAILDSKYQELYQNLNMSQRSAVDSLIGNNLSGAIQGPPGTGKTQLLQAVISLAMASGMKVCVSSFTNTAVDNLLGRIVRENFDYDWLRIGDPNKIIKAPYGNNFNPNQYISTKFFDEMSELDLYAATMHKLAFNKSAPKVDLLVIDEAGQVPIYFWPFIERLAHRVVVVGDQFQLPPVLTGQHSYLPFDNIFSFAIDDNTPMLETQYRMRQEIQAWSSEKFYKGKLRPDAKVAKNDFFAGHPAFYVDGYVVPQKFTSTHVETTARQEADYITEKINSLVRNNTNLDHVGVICPYRSQAGLVNSALQNKLGPDLASKVLVDTVERFQGQEKEAIFLSLGNVNGVPADLSFLSDSKRLNVSITRAKSRFFCLFDNKILEASKKEKKSEDLHEFLKWLTDSRTTIRRAA